MNNRDKGINMSIKDQITKWLIEESFTVTKLETPPEARVSWSIGVTTPGVPGIRFSVIMPMEKQDRVVLVMGIAISQEHKSELEKLKPTERVKVIHSILLKALSVCTDCKIAVQPDVVNPFTIAINMEIFGEEIERYGKSYFMKLLTRFLNTYLAIVSGFNEWFPVLPQVTKEKEPRTYI
ncbi:MAG: DUF2299 family protein [Desulfurococcaceae archaeon]